MLHYWDCCVQWMGLCTFWLRKHETELKTTNTKCIWLNVVNMVGWFACDGMIICLLIFYGVRVWNNVERYDDVNVPTLEWFVFFPYSPHCVVVMIQLNGSTVTHCVIVHVSIVSIFATTDRNALILDHAKQKELTRWACASNTSSTNLMLLIRFHFETPFLFSSKMLRRKFCKKSQVNFWRNFPRPRRTINEWTL